MKTYYLLVHRESGVMTIEKNVGSIPSRLTAGGWRCWEVLPPLGSTQPDNPIIGNEVTIDDGTVVSTTKNHQVMAGDKKIGEGASRISVEPKQEEAPP